MNTSILIVDDEANQRFIFEQALCGQSYTWTITTAANAQEALALMESQHPALVITDYNMPGKNGLEFIIAMRKRGFDGSIILMTAYSSPEMHEAAKEHRVSHYLAKPVSLALLRQITKDVMCKDTSF